jgi:hypothetical protein
MVTLAVYDSQCLPHPAGCATTPPVGTFGGHWDL